MTGEKSQRTNNDLQNLTHTTNDRAIRTPLKTGGDHGVNLSSPDG
jgi:hypothetical protein